MKTVYKIFNLISLAMLLFLSLYTFITQTPVNWFAGGVLWLYMFLNTLGMYLESNDSEK